MSNNVFDRVVITPREQPLSSDVVRMASEADRTVRELLRTLLGGRTSNLAAGFAPTPKNGFLNQGFMVYPQSPTALGVRVMPGFGFIDAPADVPTDIGGYVALDDRCAYKPLVLSAEQALTLAAEPGVGNERYDLIEVTYRREVTDNESRLVLNLGTGVFEPATVPKTLTFDLLGETGSVVSPAASTAYISVKTGVVALAGAGVVPTGTAGYLPLAVVKVGASVTTIDWNVIRDERPLLMPDNTLRASMECVYHTATTDQGPGTTHFQVPTGIRCAVSTHDMDREIAGPTVVPLHRMQFILLAGGEPLSTDLPSVTVAARRDVDYPTNDLPDSAMVGILDRVELLTVDATLQTRLADPVKTTPALSVAVGQKVIAVTAHAVHISSVAVSVPSINVHLSVHVSARC
jgi:hypothetical protein